MGIEEDVLAGKDAKLGFECLEEDVAKYSDHAKIKYWQKILKLTQELLDKHGVASQEKKVRNIMGVIIEAMTDEESRKFDSEIMPFGKHKGSKISEIPLQYLVWLSEQPNFNNKLTAYLQSPRIKRELLEEESVKESSSVKSNSELNEESPF